MDDTFYDLSRNYVGTEAIYNYDVDTSLSIQKLLRKLYVKYMGGNSNHPFTGVLYDECENTLVYTSYSMKLKLYSDYQIQKHFGYTFSEFIKLYPFEYPILFKEAKRIMEKLDKGLKELDLLKEIDGI